MIRNVMLKDLFIYRFLKRFTQYVLDKTKGQPALW